MPQSQVYLAAAAFMLLAASVAYAQPPNDEFASATVISSLPFSNSIDTSEATVADDPSICFPPSSFTVWYKFTPAQGGAVEVDTAGSNYDTVVDVFKGGAVDALQGINCIDDVSESNSSSKLQFTAAPNATYYIKVGACCGGPGGLPAAQRHERPGPGPFRS